MHHVYIYIYIYMEGGWKVHRLTKMGSLIFKLFKLAPFVVHILKHIQKCHAWIPLVKIFINSRYEVIIWTFSPMNFLAHIYIYIYIYIYILLLLLLATVVEGHQKASFSIATTQRCRRGCYSFRWITPLYTLRSVPNILLSVTLGGIKYHF